MILFSILYYKMLFNDITGVLGQAQSWVEQQWTQRIVQISVYAAILFYVLSSLDLINTVDKTILNMLGVKLGKEGSRALHAVTLGFFMFVGVKFILDPFVKQVVSGQVVEGQVVEGGDDAKMNEKGSIEGSSEEGDAKMNEEEDGTELMVPKTDYDFCQKRYIKEKDDNRKLRNQIAEIAESQKNPPA